jgi:hypothetical protein
MNDIPPQSKRMRNAWTTFLLVSVVLTCAVVVDTTFFASNRTTMKPPAAAAPAPDANNTRTSKAEDAGKRTRTQKSMAGSAIAALPPRGTPVAETYEQLKIRADSGDATAASRLYHDLHRCRMARTFQQIIDARLDRELPSEAGTTRLSATEIKRRQTALDSMQEQLDFVRDNEALCAGLGDERINSIVPASLRAAQLGDLRALDCYVGSDMALPGLLDHPEWLTQFKENLPNLMDAAIERGDWVVVELAHHAYAGAFPDTPRGQLLGADPVMDYRYLRLERLGAGGTFITKLDRMLNEASRQLTPQQVADGDSWAQDQYARYFAGSSSNEVSNGANICQMADD